MLNENIKTLRKQKGYSQESMAQQLNVVRQTVSKWEKGLSVPDAEMLNAISELFEVPVSTLLGSTIPEVENENVDNSKLDEIANQLAVLNEQLANQAARKRKKTKRILLGVIIAPIVLFILYLSVFIIFKSEKAKNTTICGIGIECELKGEKYYYEIYYDDFYRIHASGGDAFITNHVIADHLTDDAQVLVAQIEDYFTDRGGTYKIIDLGCNTGRLINDALHPTTKAS